MDANIDVPLCYPNAFLCVLVNVTWLGGWLVKEWWGQTSMVRQAGDGEEAAKGGLVEASPHPCLLPCWGRGSTVSATSVCFYFPLHRWWQIEIIAETNLHSRSVMCVLILWCVSSHDLVNEVKLMLHIHIYCIYCTVQAFLICEYIVIDIKFTWEPQPQSRWNGAQLYNHG